MIDTQHLTRLGQIDGVRTAFTPAAIPLPRRLVPDCAGFGFDQSIPRAAWRITSLIPNDRTTVPVGVYGGMNNATYFQKHLSTRPNLVEAVGEFQVMLANEKDFIATRVAHRINLTGPAVSIHAYSPPLATMNFYACEPAGTPRLLRSVLTDEPELKRVR